jgi:hypothetical protein
MTANPWDKFFWNDWETDAALKLCTLAAQGLWMRILCICAKADPKGYLVVAGRPLSPADLASLVGKPEPEVETLLRELAQYGVFSTDRIGRIYNRRMVRQVKKARTAQENGKKGGNPTLLKQSEISPSDNQPVKPPDKPHKPKAISQEPKETPPSLRSGGGARPQDELPGMVSSVEKPSSKIFRPDRSDLDAAYGAYNATAARVGWPACQRQTKTRDAALRARLAEAGGLDGWKTALEKAEASDFLCGRSPPREGRAPFFADIDFLIRESAFTRLMEGRYDNHKPSDQNGSNLSPLDLSLLRAAARHTPGGAPGDDTGSGVEPPALDCAACF